MALSNIYIMIYHMLVKVTLQ